MSTTLLCATVTATSMAELRRRRDQVAGADLVELRLDGIGDLDVSAALEGRRLPVIVTCRPTWQGGRHDGDEAARVAVLERAWDLGAEWVDVEDGAADAFVARVRGRRIVRSYHDFDGVPADLEARFRHLLASGAEVVKLAVMAHRLADVVTLRGLARTAPGRTVLLGQTLQNYGYDIVLLIALLVVASMFVGVCYHAYTRYSEIHTGRATWGQFGLTVAVGAILLVVGIWLLTKATGVL